MARLNLEIVTPEGQAFSGEVEMVVLPGSEGELGILPQHTAVVTQLQPGELMLLQEGRPQWLAVGSGFVEVTGESVRVLTDMAVEEHEIDEEAAQRAMARAEEAMRQQRLGSEEIATIQATLQKSLAQLKVKRRRPL
jgi:F-type H+-transporting ATPase subunit epsilon